MRRLTTIAAIVGLLAASGCGSEDGGGSTGSTAERLTHQRDALQAELELAGGKAPYLLLDRAGSRLILKLGAATLREYPVLSQGARTPRIAFFPVGSVADPRGRVWTGGRLDPAPQRVQREIVPPTEAPAGAAEAVEKAGDTGDKDAEVPEEEPAMPPLPEELVPAPDQYAIRFGEDFAIEVRTTPRPRGGSLSDLTEVLSGDATAGLSVVMPEVEAGALYRSLGEDISLIVL